MRAPSPSRGVSGAPWTDQSGMPTIPTMTAECPHCMSEIPMAATRCPHCGGENRHCPACHVRVAVNVQEKWKGALRGGKQVVVSCRRCRKVLEGSRW